MALYRTARRTRWWRLLLNGLAGSAVGLVAGWTIDQGTGLLALAMPVALFGVPGALTLLTRSRSGRDAGRVLLAWAVSAIAAALAVVPL